MLKIDNLNTVMEVELLCYSLGASTVGENEGMKMMAKKSGVNSFCIASLSSKSQCGYQRREGIYFLSMGLTEGSVKRIIKKITLV